MLVLFFKTCTAGSSFFVKAKCIFYFHYFYCCVCDKLMYLFVALAFKHNIWQQKWTLQQTKKHCHEICSNSKMNKVGVSVIWMLKCVGISAYTTSKSKFLSSRWMLNMQRALLAIQLPGFLASRTVWEFTFRQSSYSLKVVMTRLAKMCGAEAKVYSNRAAVAALEIKVSMFRKK